MKTFKILVILCLLHYSTEWSTNAQSAKEVINLTAAQIKNSFIDSLTPARRLSIPLQLSRPIDLRPTLTAITNKTGSEFYFTNRNYYDLINMRVLSIDEIARLPLGSGSMPEIGISGTFNIKWENGSGIPFIDPAIAYYCPYKKAEKPTLCGCCFYRVAAFVIPRMMLFSYPGGKNTRIYPPAYMQPRFLTTDIRK
jgi:hypothetical protein